MSLGAMGAFTSLDLFFFFIFHDFALIATFLLIGIWGSQNRQFASFQITIYLMAGSLILLAGFVALVMALPAKARTFDIVALQPYFSTTHHPLAHRRRRTSSSRSCSSASAFSSDFSRSIPGRRPDMPPRRPPPPCSTPAS